MKSSIPPPPLASLLSKLVDGELSADEMAKLEGILRHSAEAREYYREYLGMHLELAESLEQVARAPVGARAKPRAANWRGILLPMAAAVVLLAGLVYLIRQMPDTDATANQEPDAGPVLAEITMADQVQWNLPEDARVGQTLNAGPVRLLSGTLALTFGGGQLITLSAPSSFEIISATELALQQGRASLRMDGDGTAQCGIRVPRGRIVDIGTEFSVRVDETGTADVWVFEGKAMVTLQSGTNPGETKTLSVGESVRMTEVLAPSPAKAADFIRPLARVVPVREARERVIADFAADFPPSTRGYQEAYRGDELPSAGWKYLWNPSGLIGRSADYQPLVPNTVDEFPEANGGGRSPMFTNRGDVAFHHRGQGAFVFGRIAMTAIHPGKKDCRAIVAYTIQPGEEGAIRIAGSALSKHRIDGVGANGVDLDVFVNDTLVAPLSKDGFQSLTSSSFDGLLGRLSAGDTVYVTVGNNGEDSSSEHDWNDAFDACRIDFRLLSAP